MGFCASYYNRLPPFDICRALLPNKGSSSLSADDSALEAVGLMRLGRPYDQVW